MIVNGTQLKADQADSYPFDQIDIRTIATAEIVQGGQEAVALYGADAANGVIVVTLK